MTIELDHVFVLTSAGAPEADGLAGFGLVEGAPNTHPGQGTANRRFFFRNAMIEFLWVHDPKEAGSDLVRPLRLFDRWKSRQGAASPFGICLRPAGPPGQDSPFAAWPYSPPYLPKPLAIYIGDNASSLHEPLLFYIDFGRKPDPARTPHPLDHAAGFQEITAIRITHPSKESLSPEAAAVEQAGVVKFVPGNEHFMEIGFDGEKRGRTADFRPELPLRFHD